MNPTVDIRMQRKHAEAMKRMAQNARNGIAAQAKSGVIAGSETAMSLVFYDEILAALNEALNRK